MGNMDKFALLWIEFSQPCTSRLILGLFFFWYILCFNILESTMSLLKWQYLWNVTLILLVELWWKYYQICNQLVLLFFKVGWKQIGSRQASGHMAKYCESCKVLGATSKIITTRVKEVFQSCFCCRRAINYGKIDIL